MTKKDYIKIAKILKTTELEPHKRASLAVSFASVCKEDNPNFDVQRFLDACGLTRIEELVAEEPEEERFIRATREVLRAPIPADAFKNVPKRL